jgi:hypothetical protein
MPIVQTAYTGEVLAVPGPVVPVTAAVPVAAAPAPVLHTMTAPPVGVASPTLVDDQVVESVGPRVVSATLSAEPYGVVVNAGFATAPAVLGAVAPARVQQQVIEPEVS